MERSFTSFFFFFFFKLSIYIIELFCQLNDKLQRVSENVKLTPRPPPPLHPSPTLILCACMSLCVIIYRQGLSDVGG